jgi:hypothetical protein
MRARRFITIGLGTAALVASGASAVLPATGASGGSANSGQQAVRAAARAAVQERIVAAAEGLGPAGGSPAAGRGTRLTGSLHIPGGLNADVYAYHGFAYVGTWSGPCPGTGVKIIDVGDPAHPHQVATAAGYPNTSAEDMQVVSVHTGAFDGDLLGVGLQDCGLPDEPPGRAGLDLWDVTDPASPAHLGFFDSSDVSGGVHELSLVNRTIGGTARAYALTAQPYAEVISTAFAGTPRGDFQLIDVTDPTAPVLADDWGAGKDGGLAFGDPFFGEIGLPAPFDCTPPPGGQQLCRGHFPSVFGHSASPSADGRTAYVAYWDAGAVILDMTDPTNLTMIGRTIYPPNTEGDTHSSVPHPSRPLLATTDEDFSPGEVPAAGEPKEPGDTWGFARLWDISNPAQPLHLSDVATAHSLTNKNDAFYSAHNPTFRGNRLYVSWYSDGLRVFDVTDAIHPKPVAFYRPQPTRDPTGVFQSFGAKDKPYPFVWGVHLDGGLAYLSDINYGLYIVTVR